MNETTKLIVAALSSGCCGCLLGAGGLCLLALIARARARKRGRVQPESEAPIPAPGVFNRDGE